MQTGLIYEDNRVSHDKSSVEEDISCCVTMTSWKFTPHTSMVCTANIPNVKTSFLPCTVSHCTSAALWAFGCCLKCRENDELEVHASKPLWCALQIFSMQKIYFFAVFHFYMQLCCTLGIQVQRNNCNVEEDILCCVTKMS